MWTVFDPEKEEVKVSGNTRSNCARADVGTELTAAAPTALNAH
jgi:hypothetical protein